MRIGLILPCKILCFVLLYKLNLFTCVECDSNAEFDSIQVIDSRSDSSNFKPENIINLESNDPPKTTPVSSSSEVEIDNIPPLLIVDIKNKQSNDLIFYERDNINRGDVFTAIKPNLIEKITDDDELLWQPKDSPYPFKVFVGDKIEGKRHIRVFFPYTKPKDPIQEPVQSEQSEQSEPLHPRPEYDLIEIDIGNKMSDDYITYENDFVYERETFICNPGFLISKVLKNGRFLIRSPKNRYFDKVIILKDKHGVKHLRCVFHGHIDKTDLEEYAHKPEPRKPVFVTLDINNREGSDYISYFYNRFNQIHTFIPNPGFIIDRIVKGKHQMWEYEHGFYPEKALVIDDDYGNPELFLHFPKGQIPEDVPKSTPISVESKPVPVKTVVPLTYNFGKHTYKKRPVELILDFTKNEDVFNYETFIGNHIYTPTVEHLFDNVQIYDSFLDESFVLWKAYNPYEYSYKVEQFGYHSVVVYLNNGKSVSYNRDDDGIWTVQVIDKKLPEKVTPTIPEVKPAVDKIEVEDKLSLAKGLISIDIGNRLNTFKSEFRRKGHIGTFTPCEGFTVNAVIDSLTLTSFGKATKIWRTNDPNEYSNKIELDLSSNIITIHLENGQTKKFIKIYNIWVDYSFDHAVDNSNKTPFTLYLDQKSPYATYEYNTDIFCKTVTCIAKDGYAIKCVMFSNSYFTYFSTNSRAWCTDNSLYYAHKIFVKYLKLGQRLLTIELFNGLQLTYHRPTWGLPWEYLGSRVLKKKKHKSAD